MMQQLEHQSVRLEDRIERIAPNKAANLLLWCIVAFFAIFLIWAALAELDRAVRGNGRVIPSAELQTVSNLEGGIVGKILVKPGQIVKQGTPLIELDATQSVSELGSTQTATDALGARAERLRAEIQGRSPNFAESNNPLLREQIQTERALHQARLAELASTTQAARAQLVQAERAAGEAHAAVTSREAAASAARQQLEMIRPLVSQGIEPRLSLVQAESSSAVANAELVQAHEALARAQAGVAAARASIAQQRSDWRSRAAAELAATGSDRDARQSALLALTDRLDRRIVRAPLSGRVNRVLVSTVGGTVRPGEPIVEIVPMNDSLVIEAFIDPKDIAFVRIGQPARTSITAYDSAIYGTLAGKVTGISPDAVLDQRTGASHFIVRVEMDQPSIKDRQGHRLPVGPGMVASVSLLGDKRTVLAYLLTPITRLSETAFRE
jgi:membrane fusion protein, adhesin transport system